MADSVTATPSTMPPAPAEGEVAPPLESPVTPGTQWSNALADRLQAENDAKEMPTADKSATVAKPAEVKTEQPAAKEAEHPDDESDSDDADDADSADNADDEDEEEEATVPDDDDLTAALAAEGITVQLDKLDPAARKIVEKKLSDLQAGFTRLRQQDRAELATFYELQADKTFNEANAADLMAHRYQTDAAFRAKVDARFDELQEHPRAVEYLKKDLDVARASAHTAVSEERAAQEAMTAYLTRVDTTVREVAAAAGLPQKQGVPVSKALRLLIADRMDHSDTPLKKSDIVKIVGEYARETRTIQRSAKRAQSAASVVARVDASKGPPRVKGGSSPAPAAAPAIKNKNDFINSMAAKLEK